MRSEVVELARSGKRMQAAKLYAERTGANTLTAQRVVNGLSERILARRGHQAATVG